MPRVFGLDLPESSPEPEPSQPDQLPPEPVRDANDTNYLFPAPKAQTSPTSPTPPTDVPEVEPEDELIKSIVELDAKKNAEKTLEKTLYQAKANESADGLRATTDAATMYERFVEKHPVLGPFVGGALEGVKGVFFDLPMFIREVSYDAAKLATELLPFTEKTQGEIKAEFEAGKSKFKERVSKTEAFLTENLPIPTAEVLSKGKTSLLGHFLRELGGITALGPLLGAKSFFKLLKLGFKPSPGLTAYPKVVLTQGLGNVLAAYGLGVADHAYYNLYRAERLKKGEPPSPWLDLGAAIASGVGGSLLGSYLQGLALKGLSYTWQAGSVLKEAGLTKEKIEKGVAEARKSGIPTGGILITELIDDPNYRGLLNDIAALTPGPKQKILNVLKARYDDIDKSINELKKLDLPQEKINEIRTRIIHAAAPSAEEIEAKAAQMNEVIAELADLYNQGAKAATTPEAVEKLGNTLSEVVENTDKLAREANRSLWQIVHEETGAIRLNEEDAKIVGEKTATVFDLHHIASDLRRAAYSAENKFDAVELKRKADQVEDILMNLDAHGYLDPARAEEIRRGYEAAKKFHRYYKENFDENPLVQMVISNIKGKRTGTYLIGRVSKSIKASEYAFGKFSNQVDNLIKTSKEILGDLKDVDVSKLDTPTLAATQEIANTMAWQIFKSQLEASPDLNRAVDAALEFSKENAVVLRDIGVLDDIRGSLKFLREIKKHRKDLAERIEKAAIAETDLAQKLSARPTDHLLATIYNSEDFLNELKSVKEVANKAGMQEELSRATVSFFLRSIEKEGTIPTKGLAELFENSKNVKMAESLMTPAHREALKSWVEKAKKLELLPTESEIRSPIPPQIDILDTGIEAKAFLARLSALYTTNKLIQSNLVIQQQLGKFLNKFVYHLVTSPASKAVGELITDPEMAKFALALAEETDPNRIVKAARRAMALSSTVKKIDEMARRQEKEEEERRQKNFMFRDYQPQASGNTIQ